MARAAESQEPREPPVEGGEHFDVFISYSRKDVAFAERLERALEAYKAPASLPLARRRLNVFRDAQDLIGHDYGEAIRGQLRRSTRMLVICTPRARASTYVDQEIEWFLETHDRAGVISLLLDGLPNNEVDAEDSRRAFPAQLCKAHAMPLATDYRGFDIARHKPAKPPYDGAWYTLLANIYGLDRNIVEERDRLRQRREHRIVTAIAAAVMASLAVAAVFSWVQMRRAEEQRDVAVRGFARYLAMKSEEMRSTTPETALLLAVEAARTTRDLDDTLTGEAELALRRALSEAGGMYLGVGTRLLSFSPDGHWLARAEENGIVTAWDLTAPESQPARVTLPKTEPGSLSFGPARRLAVFTRNRDRVALLDVQDLRKPPRWLAPRVGAIHGLQFSADGAAVIVLDDGADITVVDLTDPAASPTVLKGHTLHRIGDKFSGTRDATFSATDRWIASTGWDGTLFLWDRKDRDSPPQRLLTAKLSPSEPLFSADGRWLFAHTNSLGPPALAPFTLWYLGGPTPQQVTMDSGEVAPDALTSSGATPNFPLTSFTATNRLIMAGQTETFVWTLNPEGARIDRRIPQRLVALGGDGRHFATVAKQSDEQSKISLWDAEASEPEARVEAPASLEGVGYSAVGRRLIAKTAAGELLSWQLGDRDFESNPQRYRGATGNMMLMSPDGRTAVIGYWYGNARLWDLANPSLDPVHLQDVDEDAELKTKTRSGGSGGKPHGGLQQMLAFDEQAQRVAITRNRGVMGIVNLQHPNRASVAVPVQEGGVSAIAFSPDGGTVAVGDRRSTVRLYHAGEMGEPFATLRVPTEEESVSSLSALVFSHSGKRLAAGGDFGTVAVWDLSAPSAQPITLTNHKGWVTGAAFSANDRSLLVASDDGKASVVTLANPKSVRMLEGHAGPIRAAFTAADQFIVTAGMDATIRVWSTSDAKAEPRVLRGHSGPITTFALVLQKQRIITASDDGTLRVWNLLGADRPEKIIVVRTPLNVVKVSHDGRWLALGGLSGKVEIRRMDALDQTGLELPAAVPERRKDGEVFALQFSPDDRWLAALTPGRGRLWRLRPDELMLLACEASGRNLDAEEWERYLSDLSYRLTCPAWGLGPGYLEYARHEAELGAFDHAVSLLKRAHELVPDLPFNPLAEATRNAVAGVLDRGRSLARKGESDAALAELVRVQQIDPKSTFEPLQEIERVKKSGELVKQASAQARKGELETAIATYREALKLDPSLKIDPVQEVNKIYAPVLVKEGHALAAEGKMEEGVARLERAASLDMTALYDSPEADARSARAEALMIEAGKLAKQGELQAAIAGYRAALAVNDKLRIDPEAEAGKIVAEYWMHQAFSRSDLPSALDLFDKARALDAKERINSYSANELCWRALQRGYAKRALRVCNAVVADDADNWMARDSRGVARLLTGNTAGAIEDFEFYVKKSDREDSVKQRKRWIARLKSGWRPQSVAELDAK